MDWAALGGILGGIAFVYTAFRVPTVERLKSDLERERAQSSVLYERRLEMIAELYEKLADVEFAAIQYMKPLRLAGEEAPEESEKRFADAYNDFLRFFARRRLFVPKDIAEDVQKWRDQTFRTATEFSIMRDSQSKGWAEPDSVFDWPKLWARASGDLPDLRQEIEDRFRMLLDPPKRLTRRQRVAEWLQSLGPGNKRSKLESEPTDP